MNYFRKCNFDQNAPNWQHCKNWAADQKIIGRFGISDPKKGQGWYFSRGAKIFADKCYKMKIIIASSRYQNLHSRIFSVSLIEKYYILLCFLKNHLFVSIFQNVQSRQLLNFTGYHYIITKHLLVKFDCYTLCRFRNIKRKRWFSENHNRSFRSEQRQ